MAKRIAKVTLPERRKEPYGLAALHGSKGAQQIYHQMGRQFRGRPSAEVICATLNFLIASSQAVGAKPEDVIGTLISTWDQYDFDSESVEDIAKMCGL